MRFQYGRYLLAFSVGFCATLAHAKGDGPRRPMSPVVSIDYNTPAPSGMSLNLGVNLLPFLRVSGGLGAYIKSGDPLLKAYSVGLFSTFGYILTLGKVRYDRIYDYLGGNSDGWESVLTKGFNITLFVPGMSLSPALGVGYSSYLATEGAYGVLTEGRSNHVYYSGGLDWTDKGFHAKAGMHYSPQLPSKLQKTFYLGIGAAF